MFTTGVWQTSRGFGGRQVSIINISGAAAWSPAQLSGLIAWYSADFGVYSDAGVTPATNGQDVTQWNDRSGNGYHLSSSIAPGQFLSAGFNGKQCIQFVDDGNQRGMIVSPVNMGTGNVGSCFVTGMATASANAVARIISFIVGADENNASSALLMHLQGTTEIDAQHASGNLAGMTIVNGTNYRSWGMIFDGVNCTSYLNNVAQNATGVNFNWANGGQISIGRKFDTANPFDGQYAEIVLTNTALSVTDRGNLDTYLTAKWGL